LPDGRLALIDVISTARSAFGHATTSFTMHVYMHAIPALEDDAADQIADVLFGNADVDDSDDDPDADC
jgi:hypothetical protein